MHMHVYGRIWKSKQAEGSLILVSRHHTDSRVEPPCVHVGYISGGLFVDLVHRMIARNSRRWSVGIVDVSRTLTPNVACNIHVCSQTWMRSCSSVTIHSLSGWDFLIQPRLVYDMTIVKVIPKDFSSNCAKTLGWFFFFFLSFLF